MTYGRAEQRRPTMLLGNSQQGKFRFEVDKLLNNHLLHVTARAFHCLLESLLQLAFVMHIALSMSARRHQGLHHTRESNFLRSLLELFEGLGIEVLRGS